jgi:ferredoxin-NADP reductase
MFDVQTRGADVAVPTTTGRPMAPRWVIPVIDGVVRARPTTVIGVDALTPTIHRVRIERPPGYRFRPGQHALLRLSTERGPDLRPLSLAGHPDAPYLEFATRAGTSAFKHAFVALRAGDQVKVSRPMGGFDHDPSRAAVLVAGGLGITALRSLLLAEDAGDHGRPIRLLYSNRTAGEIPFADELFAVAGRRGNVSISWLLTRPDDDPFPDGAHAGRVTEEVLHRELLQQPDAVFYVTGPAAMVTDVRSMLQRLGVHGRRVRSVPQGSRPGSTTIREGGRS